MLRPWLLLSVAILPSVSAAAEPTYRAGFARANITPDKPMWLAGYGNRTRPSEGKLHDIWIKALALEDGRGYKVVLLTSDLCGMPKWMYENRVRRSRRSTAWSASKSGCATRTTTSPRPCAASWRTTTRSTTSSASASTTIPTGWSRRSRDD